MKTQALSALASELVRAGLELAARGHDGAHKLKGGDGPMSQGGGEPLDPSPRLNAEGSASNSGMRKEAGTPVSETFRPVNGGGQTTGETVKGRSGLTNGHRMAPALPYPSRSIVTVSNTTPHRESPAGSAVIIDLVVWREVHRPAAQDAKSGSARANSPNAKTMIQSF
jgi:hypothetical protein